MTPRGFKHVGNLGCSPLKMGSKDLALTILLVLSGELRAEEKPCGLPSVENGQVALYYYTFTSFYFPMSVDQKLSFSCLAGYTTDKGKQEEKTTCTAGGWSPEPRCFKKCPRPDLANGHISDSKVLYAVQEALRYGCASGFRTPSGRREEEVRCLPHGWSSPPACREEQDTCVAPALLHGNYSTTQTTFRVQEKVGYRCDPGYYTATGGTTEEAECHAHGWSLPPKCTKLKCSPLRLIENGYFYPVKQTYEEGEVVQFFCHENYFLSGSDLIQCYNFGWYPESPVCEGRRSRCPPPPLPPNSKVQAPGTTYRHGEAVRIECEPGFERQGPEEIRCGDGRWTEPPTCTEEREAAACGDPPLVANGAPALTSKTYRSGDSVSYACGSGYRLRGPREVTCRRGRWTPAPECVENTETCKRPPDIANGAVVDGPSASYPAGSSVEYRCHEYYILQGARTSRCADGQWSPPPACLEPCTVDEGSMARNNIGLKWRYEGKVLHGDWIDFVCKPGFDLAPAAPPPGFSVQCSRGRLTYPVCVRRESKGTCGPPPLIENGVVVGARTGTYENGSSVEYRCSQHHFLQGPRDSHCLEGVWTAPPSCLEPCVLSPAEMDKNNLLLKWSFDNRPYIFHGEYVHFLCRRDTYMAELSPVGIELPVRCDRGQLRYPRCVQRRRTPSYQEPVRT